MMKLLKEIQSWAKQEPNRPAYICNQSVLTYGDLEQKSNRLASWIKETYKDDQTPVIVFGHMQSEMIIAFLACVKSGHAYIPVDHSTPASRLAVIVEDSKSNLILSPVDLPEDLVDLNSDCLAGEALQSIIENQPELTYEALNNLQNEQAEEDNFYIIYTSGSTGRPKGVQITHGCLNSFVEWAISAFQLTFDQGVYLNQAPYSFDLSVMDLYPALVTGGTLWAAHHDLIASPRNLFEQLKSSGLTVWTSTPSFAELCLSDQTFNSELLPELRRFLFCGEVLQKETARKLYERFPEAKVFNSYGPTEATVAITSLEVERQDLLDQEALPVGVCKPDSEIRIVDEEGLPVQEGEKGEILIIGPSVSKGYLGNDRLTQQSFFIENGKRGYRTRDAGLIKNGMLYYKGRMDLQIKLNGYRMELEEIEHHLNEVSYVKNGFVVPILKDGRTQFLTAYVVSQPHTFNKDYELTTEIKNELKQVLPTYMIPRKIIFVDRIPMTTNGKVDRKAFLEEL